MNENIYKITDGSLYVVHENGCLYRSIDGGRNWREIAKRGEWSQFTRNDGTLCFERRYILDNQQVGIKIWLFVKPC